jgi:cytochrome c biogenesis protein CcmG/thiol:disulfide interchange protein DsbE
VQGDRTLTQADLLGRPALVNVWGTWCPSCKVEHPYLNQLAEQGVVIYGVNYKDDNAAARSGWPSSTTPTSWTSATSKAPGPGPGRVRRAGNLPDRCQGHHPLQARRRVDATVWREQLAPLYQGLVDEAKP